MLALLRRLRCPRHHPFSPDTAPMSLRPSAPSYRQDSSPPTDLDHHHPRAPSSESVRFPPVTHHSGPLTQHASLVTHLAALSPMSPVSSGPKIAKSPPRPPATSSSASPDPSLPSSPL